MQIERIPAAPPLHAWRIPTGSFPLPAPRREELSRLVAELLAAGETEAREPAVLLFPGGAQAVEEVVRRNAGRWRLRPGLGVRPEDDPPRTPGVLDTMLNMLGGRRPEDLTLYRPGARLSAEEFIESATGYGGLIAAACPGSADDCLAAFERGLTSYLGDPAAKGKGFYAPVLSRSSLTDARTAAVLADATLYVREIPDDQEALIVSREPIDSLP